MYVMLCCYRVPPLLPTTEVKDDRFDAVLVVTDTIDKLKGDLECLKEPLEDYGKVNLDFHLMISFNRMILL